MNKIVFYMTDGNEIELDQTYKLNGAPVERLTSEDILYDYVVKCTWLTAEKFPNKPGYDETLPALTTLINTDQIVSVTMW